MMGLYADILRGKQDSADTASVGVFEPEAKRKIYFEEQSSGFPEYKVVKGYPWKKKILSSKSGNSLGDP